MVELELTFPRLLSIWWLMMWRGFVGALIIGAIAGFIAGAGAAIVGHPEFARTAGGYAGLVITPFWVGLILYMALKKKYRGFRIALLQTDEM